VGEHLCNKHEALSSNTSTFRKERKKEGRKGGKEGGREGGGEERGRWGGEREQCFGALIPVRAAYYSSVLS
jgi:hypothetical protein